MTDAYTSYIVVWECGKDLSDRKFNFLLVGSVENYARNVRNVKSDNLIQRLNNDMRAGERNVWLSKNNSKMNCACN